MEFCKKQLQTNNDIEEYDAVAISWTKKLKRMDTTQAIFAETLFNKVFNKGLFKRLTDRVTLSEAEGQSCTACSLHNQYTVLCNASDQR